MLPTDKLKINNKDGNTVLGYCALVGNIEMEKCIVDKCPILLCIANGPHGLVPVVMALMHNSNTKAMAQYLFLRTKKKHISFLKLICKIYVQEKASMVLRLLLDAFIP